MRVWGSRGEVFLPRVSGGQRLLLESDPYGFGEFIFRVGGCDNVTLSSEMYRQLQISLALNRRK